MQKRNDRGFADGVMELRPADKAATLYDMEGRVSSSTIGTLAGECRNGVPHLIDEDAHAGSYQHV
jgi:hypothetical protein